MGRIRSALAKTTIFALGVVIGYRIGSFMLYLLPIDNYIENRNQAAQLSFVKSSVAVDRAELEAVLEFLDAYESQSPSSPSQQVPDDWRMQSVRDMDKSTSFVPSSFLSGVEQMSGSDSDALFGDFDNSGEAMFLGEHDDIQESIDQLNEFLEGDFGLELGVGDEFDIEEFERLLKEQVKESDFHIDIDGDGDSEDSSNVDGDSFDSTGL